MATSDLISIGEDVGRLDLDGCTPRRVEQRAQWRLVNTPDDVKCLVRTLFSLEATHDAIYLDLEGANLSRHGSISLIQIWVPLREQAILVDVYTLGINAFNAVNSEGKTLKQVFESETIRKYLFDVRNDADALSALFDVQLAGVIDVQLLELASRNGPKHVVCSLAACIEQEQVLSGPALCQWRSTKTEVVKMFDPKIGGSYEVFNERPLSPILVDYCVGDVQFLPMLSVVYQDRLDNMWLGKELEIYTKENGRLKYNNDGLSHVRTNVGHRPADVGSARGIKSTTAHLVAY